MKTSKSTIQIRAVVVAKSFIKIMINSKNLRQYFSLIKYFKTQKSSFFSVELSYQI